MEWLQRLYELDAGGVVDEELLDKVGYRLYDRCRDCIIVIDSVGGRFTCVMCHRGADVADGTVRCTTCGWTIPLADFRVSWRHMELNADPTFLREFVRSWMAARTPRQKML